MSYATQELIYNVADFAERMAKTLRENQSSTALFFVQQAYESEDDSLQDLHTNTIALLELIQVQASMLKKIYKQE